MTDIVINGTVVRVGQVWEDNFSNVYRVISLHEDSDYPIYCGEFNFAASGFKYKSKEGEDGAWHLIRCIHDPSAEPAPAVKAGRKVVQIHACGKDLVALCDDGTMWECAPGVRWLKIEPIPQGDEQ